MGRIPKLVKERALLEQKEQQMRQEAAKMVEGSEGSDEVPARESSCSSLSDRSIENYEPGSMETGKNNCNIIIQSFSFLCGDYLLKHFKFFYDKTSLHVDVTSFAVRDVLLSWVLITFLFL